MANRLSEGLTDFAGGFGLAELKCEGAAAAYDPEYPAGDLDEETFWFERPFTKVQYAQLAFALRNEAAPWLVELQKEFEERAVNGYGGGW